MAPKTTPITKQDAAQALTCVELMHTAAAKGQGARDVLLHAGDVAFHASRLPACFCRNCEAVHKGENYLGFAFELMLLPDYPIDGNWHRFAYNDDRRTQERFCSDIAQAAAELIPWLKHVGPTLPDGNPTTSEQADGLRAKKARENAKQKTKIKHAGDRKKIRAEYDILITRPGMTKTAAQDQLADQAQRGRAGAVKLSMKYATMHTCATRFDIRRIVTTTD